MIPYNGRTVSSRGTSDLLFLLSMSGLAAGCSKGVGGTDGAPFGPGPGPVTNGDEDDDGTSGKDRGESSSDGESDPILTSGPDDASDPTITTAPASTSGPPETTTGISGPDATTTGFPGETSSGPIGTSGPPPIGEPCAEYGEWAANCYGLNDGQEYCYFIIYEYGVYYGPACAAAWEELFACVSTQPCGAVGCAAEQNAMLSAC